MREKLAETMEALCPYLVQILHQPLFILKHINSKLPEIHFGIRLRLKQDVKNQNYKF